MDLIRKVQAEYRLPERLLWVVSVLAAFGHNAGQLLVAVWVTGGDNLAKVRLIPNDIPRRHPNGIKDLSVMDGDASD